MEKNLRALSYYVAEGYRMGVPYGDEPGYMPADLTGHQVRIGNREYREWAFDEDDWAAAITEGKAFVARMETEKEEADERARAHNRAYVERAAARTATA